MIFAFLKCVSLLLYIFSIHNNKKIVIKIDNLFFYLINLQRKNYLHPILIKI